MKAQNATLQTHCRMEEQYCKDFRQIAQLKLKSLIHANQNTVCAWFETDVEQNTDDLLFLESVALSSAHVENDLASLHITQIVSR